MERGDRTRGRAVDHLRLPAYVTAALFVAVSLSDIATVALPWNPSEVAWRFGTLGAASNYILTAFFGTALFCWSAAFSYHRHALRVAATASIFCAAVLGILFADFILSALQLRNIVAPSEEAAFLIGTVKAGFKYAAFSIAFLLNGVFAWRAARYLPLRR